MVDEYANELGDFIEVLSGSISFDPKAEKSGERGGMEARPLQEERTEGTFVVCARLKYSVGFRVVDGGIRDTKLVIED